MIGQLRLSHNHSTFELVLSNGVMVDYLDGLEYKQIYWLRHDTEFEYCELDLNKDINKIYELL